MTATLDMPGTRSDSAPLAVEAPLRVWPRGLLLIGCVLAAYHYSLGMTMHTLGADSPLAYLGLVPLIALALGFVAISPRRGEPEVHDRFLDRMVAVPGFVVCLVVMIVVPPRLSSFFWLNRIDLLTLPIFVASTVALLFGARALIRCRSAILFLLLAWPVPYRAALEVGLDGFTKLSAKAVGAVLHFLPIATPVPVLEGGFRVDGPGGAFNLVVATQCSGANGLLGFLLIAGAATLVTAGKTSRKVLWLVAGSAVVWLFNVVRILIVFAAGKFWGESVALDGFHPYTGLVTFSLATAIMVWVMPKFGLRLGLGSIRPAALTHSTHRAVPRWRTAAIVCLVLSFVVGVFDSGLSAYDPVISALGTPRVTAFNSALDSVTGFTGRPVDHFDWSKRFFGEKSDWTRYEFAGQGADGLTSQLPVTADVVTTDDSQTFNDFGVEACYRFHGYDVENLREVDIGRGQTASMLTWTDQTQAGTGQKPIRWTALYWYWPVASHGTIRYQRVILLFNTSSGGNVTAPPVSKQLTRQLGLGLDERLHGLDDQPLAKRDAQVREFLVGFAQRLVAGSTSGAGDD